MPEYKIVRADKAEDDLMDIAMFIALNNSVEVAYKIVDEIEHSVMRLQTMPYSGSIQKFIYTKMRGYRFLVVENYLIHYHIDEAEKTVYIDRIRHGAIAPQNQL